MPHESKRERSRAAATELLERTKIHDSEVETTGFVVAEPATDVEVFSQFVEVRKLLPFEQVAEAQTAAGRYQQEAAQLRNEADNLRASLQLSRQSQAWLALLAVAGLVGALLSLFLR